MMWVERRLVVFRLGRKVEIDIVGRKELEEYIERDIEYIEERKRKKSISGILGSVRMRVCGGVSRSAKCQVCKIGFLLPFLGDLRHF